MALGDDYSEQTGQPGDANDNGQRRRMMEFILRSALKPSIPPLQNGQSGNEGSSRRSVLGNRQTGQDASIPRGAMINTQDDGGLSRPNTKHLRAPGATPTNRAEPENPYAQTGYRPQAEPAKPDFPGPRQTGLLGSRFNGRDSSQTNEDLIRRAGGMSGESSRPNIPAPRTTDTTVPDVNANTPFTPPPSSGKRILGMGTSAPGTRLLGLGTQPARPDVQPMRSDFPAKPLPTWEKVLGIAAAPLLPGVSEAILTGPRRSAERQYEGAVKDWQRGQEGAERQARIEETQARTRSLLNPPQKEGVTPEETTMQDLTTGNNGQPQINPDTGKPYTRLEAYRTVQAAKTGAAQTAKQPPLGAADVEQINAMHTQRYQTLNPGKPLPPAFTLRPGSTQADYDRIHSDLSQMESAAGTQAQRDANNAFRRDAAANAAQSREERREEKFGQPVYAYDPDKKQTILTTQGAATKGNLQAIRKVNQPDIEKDTDKLRQIGDAQMNVSAYRVSLQGMNALSGNDLARVGALIGDDKFKLHFMGMEIPVDWYNQLRDNQKFNDLPEDAKDALVGYIGARGSIIAYTKAISGTGRLTETQLQTEMQNLPKPTDPQDVAEKKFARFQRNIDQAASGLPKIPGIDTPAEIRAKTEVTKPQMPTPAQPKAAAPKTLYNRLVDSLNRKMGAE